jgi:hypothetical protein
MHFRAARLPQIVLLCGMLVRLLAWAATPYALANDDHFAPVQIILEQNRLPRAEDCWSCYQPPLYYVIAAAVFRATYDVAGWLSGSGERGYAVARKAVQFISTVAGSATLYVCLLVLRRGPPLSSLEQALALGFVAFLPRHIHMSAMATNDSLAYLFAALAVWATLRAHESGWHSARVSLAGALAGAAVLAKAYGLVTMFCIVGVVILFSAIAARGARLADRLRPALLISACAILIGVWPSVFNVVNYGKLHVDNFDTLPTALRNQPPGAVERIDFLSFRLLALLDRPWSHVSHLDSFWTAIYSRLWFDSAGTQNTLLLSPEWQTHRALINSQTWPPGTARGIALRDYADSDTPADFRRVAIASYLLGLPLVAVTLVGFALLLRRAPRDFPAALLTLHFAACLLIPVIQTLRLPNISAMKAEFMFNNLTSIPFFVAGVIAVFSGGWRRGLTIGLTSILLGLLACDGAYVYIEYARSEQMLPDVSGM